MADNTKQLNTVKLVTAHARHLHIAPRKMRLVTNLVKGMYATDALAQLQHLNKKAAPMVAKLIGSAIANAQHNFSLDAEGLVIKSITTDGGKVMKRYMPRARGSASNLHRRMSHVHVVLEEKKRSKAKASRFAMLKKAMKQDEEKETGVKETSVPAKAATPEIKKPQVFKTEEQMKKSKVQQKRRMFNRKGGE